MLVRAIALSLALLVGIGAIIPLATQTTEAGPHKHRKHRHHKHYKKYSKAWWRQYRARRARKHALQARKRALRLEQLRLAQAHAAHDCAGYQEALKALGNGAERDFRIMEGLA